MKPAALLFAATLASPFAASAIAAIAAIAAQIPSPEPPKPPPLSLPKGAIVDRVDCAAAPNQSYALYLPTGYTPERPWPILYSLDARSDGPGAAAIFRAGAERYGYVVASSNNSASDTATDPNPAALAAMWNDTHARLALDDRRVYLAGFSGTVRSAVRMARAMPGAIAGILGAAAGFPVEAPPVREDAFLFFGTTGLGDFNYDEVLALEASLEGLGLPHHFEPFAGAHQWPPAELAERALAWFDLEAMKSGKVPRDPAWIDARWSEALSRAQAEAAAGRPYYALRAYGSAAADFAGLRDVTQASTKAAQLRGERRLQRDLKAREERSRKEQRAVAQASYLLDAANPEYGPTTVGQVAASLHLRDLQERAERARDFEERWSARRILSALRAQTAYYLPSLYLERRRYDRAIFILALASEIAPRDPYPHYRSATVWVRKGNAKKALAELALAADLGLEAAEKVEQDEDLAPLRNDEGFKAILDRLRPARVDPRPRRSDPEYLGRALAYAVLPGGLPAPSAGQGAVGPAECVPARLVHSGGVIGAVSTTTSRHSVHQPPDPLDRLVDVGCRHVAMGDQAGAVVGDGAP